MMLMFYFPSGGVRRCVVFTFLLGISISIGGCAWWDRTVVKKVKNITARSLTITTNPPGADVYVNDVRQGKSPLSLTYKIGINDMFKGFIVVVHKKGYLPVRREVSFQQKSASFRLIKKGRRRKFRRRAPGRSRSPGS